MFRAIDPTTEELIEEVAPIGAYALGIALDRARDAFAAWRDTSFEERAGRLVDVADRLRARRETLAALMTREMGKPITESRAEIDKCCWACEFYAEEAEAFLSPRAVETDAARSWVGREPLGPVLAIMPWNFPFWQVVRFAAPALMAGNVGLLKHAPNVPGCAGAIADLFDEAGFPEGVFQNLFIDESTVADVIADERVAAVTLTGSVGAGRAVAALAGRAIKPSVLELGGSDPFVVLADADLGQAVDGAMTGRFLNTGQSCIAAKRFIVEAPIYDRFVERVAERVDDLVVGDPALDRTDVGPLARADLRDALHDQVERSVAAGARIVRGGGMGTGPGWFYRPTVLADVVPGTAAFDEEVFGPVASVTVARTADDAIRLADRTRFGLGASIWTKDVERGLAMGRRFASGHLSINGIVKSDPRLPFGGVRESGYGRELSQEGILAFVNTRTYWVR